MGQTPNFVTTDDPMQDDPNFGAVYVAPNETDTTTTPDNPEVIQAEIESTRADMSQTINAIQDRLNPETLKEQAKEMVHEATVGRAQEAVSNVSDRAQEMVGHNIVVSTIRQNPIPAALAGVGLGWLWMNRSKKWHTEPYYYQPRRHTTQSQSQYYSPGFERYQQREQQYMGQQQSGGDSRFSGMADTASSALGSVQEGAGSALGSVQHTAGAALGSVQDTAGQVAGQVGNQVQDLRGKADQMLNENPVPMGLVAIGLGFAVGMMLPETEKERQIMGEQRDQLMEKAQQAGQQVVEKVQSVAQDVSSTVQQSAQEQGLTGQ